MKNKQPIKMSKIRTGVGLICAIIFVSVLSMCQSKNENTSEQVSQSSSSLKEATYGKQLFAIDSIYGISKPNELGEVSCGFSIRTMSEMTGVAYDTLYDVTSICLMDFYEKTDDMTAFLYKIKCKAGGSCSRFFIITFSATGSRVKNTLIGREESSNKMDKYFSYKKLDGLKLEFSHEIEEYNSSDELLTDTIISNTVQIDRKGNIKIL